MQLLKLIISFETMSTIKSIYHTDNIYCNYIMLWDFIFFFEVLENNLCI